MSYPAEAKGYSDTTAWHVETVTAVAEKLATHLEKGLTPEEASNRLAYYSPNELQEPPRPPFWRLVLAQFQNFVVIILIAASIVSALLGEWIDAGAIMAIVLLNAIIGVIQESKAERALAALKQMSAPNATVIRGGMHMLVSSRELVPGDVVVLEAGNYIPADVRLTEAVNLRVKEAALTGESLPVDKRAHAGLEKDAPLGDRHNMAFMSTVVSYGRGQGIVVSTGMQTQVGMIARMLQSLQHEPTPLQVSLDKLGKQLGTAALIICAVIFAVAIFNQTDLSVLFSPDGGLLYYIRTYSKDLSDEFLVAVSLAIAAIPEGLPAVVTITLAIGMREMVKRHALIRRLSAVETLGSASVICSDKTGTLTQNSMTAVRLWVDGRFFSITGEGYVPKGEFMLDGVPVTHLSSYPALLTALWTGVLASDASIEHAEENGNHSYRIVGDPTEGALVVAGAKAGVVKEQISQVYPRLNEVPFDSERKCMSVILDVVSLSPDAPHSFQENREKEGDIYVIATKGAPDMILDKCTYYQNMENCPCPMREDDRQGIMDAIESMSRDALRVLAVAYRIEKTPPHRMHVTPDMVERDLVFAGLFGMIDPPRPEVPPAIEKASKAGLRTIMITGDYRHTAEAIGRSIGLIRPGRQVLSGAEVDRLNDEELAKALETTDAFARVNPEHKMRIVDALRAGGAVVAMTGDGVNDAPALKRADIGVAMGITGTDVAKETADMVLTDDNYVSIVSAIEQGRIIYANIRKFVFFLLSSNVAEIMIIFLATMAGMPTPLTAVQLLWLNLVTDGAPALALAMEKGDPDIMEQPPRPKDEPIIHGPMRMGILIQTIVQTAAVLGAFMIGLYWHIDQDLPAGINPILALLNHNWRGVDAQAAETMAFVTLSLCELFRAFTVRSERVSIFTMGFFSNRYMVVAVASSVFLLLLTVFVPFLQPVFNTHTMDWAEWQVVLGMALMPAVVEELTKCYIRKRDRNAQKVI